MTIIVGDVTGLQHSPQPIKFPSSCREYESSSSVDKIVPKYCKHIKNSGKGHPVPLVQGNEFAFTSEA